jgi:hypothetical protein
MRSLGLVYSGRPKCRRAITATKLANKFRHGARPRSQTNGTVDGLDAAPEELRHSTEDTTADAGSGKD